MDNNFKDKIRMQHVDVCGKRHRDESYADYRQRQRLVKRALRQYRTVRPNVRLPQERYSPPHRKYRDNNGGAETQIIESSVTVESQRLSEQNGKLVWVPDVIKKPIVKVIWHQKNRSLKK